MPFGGEKRNAFTNDQAKLIFTYNSIPVSAASTSESIVAVILLRKTIAFDD
jgi:hypothetical protein